MFKNELTELQLVYILKLVPLCYLHINKDFEKYTGSSNTTT